MGFQKKHGKDRLDKWYKLAKEKGYRARAAFKLVQLNRKYGFLQQSKVLLDLCAAPGSWCQVAAEAMPSGSLIIGVDIVPMKSIPRATTIQADITADSCTALIRSHLKNWQVDTVIHDGAPNVGTAWVQDAYSQAELVLQALKLATKFLRAGGTFVTKIFRSKDYNALLWVLQQLFSSVEATKPPASRNISAEIYVVCSGFKAPQHMDHRFLDSRHVFAELQAKAKIDENRVLKPDLARRRRDGYAEAQWGHYKEASAIDFITSDDPITVLASVNKLSFDGPGVDTASLQALSKLPETTREIRECANDLKVLGRKELRTLLRWRQKCRQTLELSSKDRAQTKQPLSPNSPPQILENNTLTEDVHGLRQRLLQRERKRKRKEAEKTRQEIWRMSLHMQAPTDIGLGQSELGGGNATTRFSLFRGRNLDAINSRGRSASPSAEEQVQSESDDDSSADRLDAELDYLYNEYRSKKDAGSYRGTGRNLLASDGSINASRRHVTSDVAVSPCPEPPIGSADTGTPTFFGQASFASVDGLDFADLEGVEQISNSSRGAQKGRQSSLDPKHTALGPEVGSMANHFQSALKKTSDDEELGEEASRLDTVCSVGGRSCRRQRSDIDIFTAEAMATAQRLAAARSSRHSLADDAYNKSTFNDQSDLPSWFLDDEREFNRPRKPTSAEAVAAIKQKLQALNARPIKKVREAKQRKKARAARRIQKMSRRSGPLEML